MHRQLSMLLADLGLIALATYFGFALRDNLELFPQHQLNLAAYVGLTLLVAVPVLLAFRLNRSIWRLSGMIDYTRAAAAALTIVLATVGIAFVIKQLDPMPRSLPILQAILMIFLLVGSREFVRQRHARRFSFVQNLDDGPSNPRESILIAGLSRVTELYLQAMAEHAPDRIRVAGVLGRTQRHMGRLVR